MVPFLCCRTGHGSTAKRQSSPSRLTLQHSRMVQSWCVRPLSSCHPSFYVKRQCLLTPTCISLWSSTESDPHLQARPHQIPLPNIPQLLRPAHFSRPGNFRSRSRWETVWSACAWTAGGVVRRGSDDERGREGGQGLVEWGDMIILSGRRRLSFVRVGSRAFVSSGQVEKRLSSVRVSKAFVSVDAVRLEDRSQGQGARAEVGRKRDEEWISTSGSVEKNDGQIKWAEGRETWIPSSGRSGNCFGKPSRAARRPRQSRLVASS